MNGVYYVLLLIVWCRAASSINWWTEFRDTAKIFLDILSTGYDSLQCEWISYVFEWQLLFGRMARFKVKVESLSLRHNDRTATNLWPPAIATTIQPLIAFYWVTTGGTLSIICSVSLSLPLSLHLWASAFSLFLLLLSLPLLLSLFHMSFYLFSHSDWWRFEYRSKIIGFQFSPSLIFASKYNHYASSSTTQLSP